MFEYMYVPVNVSNGLRDGRGFSDQSGASAMERPGGGRYTN